MKLRRWQKFKFKAPRFHDPAEAFFEVKLDTGCIIKDCVWLSTKIETTYGLYECFHVQIGDAFVPILQISITHYRRQ